MERPFAFAGRGGCTSSPQTDSKLLFLTGQTKRLQRTDNSPQLSAI